MVDCTSKVDLKTLLIISGGIEAVPGIKLAKKMGFHVVVSDGNLQAPGFEHADDKIIASTYNIHDTLKKVKQYHETCREINGVMCIASDVPLTVAEISNELRFWNKVSPLHAKKWSISQFFSKKYLIAPILPVLLGSL